MRLLLTTDETLPQHYRFPHKPDVLDPSVPDVLEYVHTCVKRAVSWGYELIKHDFSTFDIFGAWGFEMSPSMASGSWHFADESRTTAEIIISLYRTILDAAGENCLILGFNCIGHLGAGLMHLQRIGDDTSGLHWERTRNIGINSLAFRLPQHKTFFEIDADCVGITGQIPWEYNKQWLSLLAQSGTSLFVSAKPGVLSEAEQADVRQAFRINALQADTCIPIDWQETTCPTQFAINGSIQTFNWYEKSGLFGFGFDIKQHSLMQNATL